jgi:selenocysteine lyase/cysteine desulfurase
MGIGNGNTRRRLAAVAVRWQHGTTIVVNDDTHDDCTRIWLKLDKQFHFKLVPMEYDLRSTIKLDALSTRVHKEI